MELVSEYLTREKREYMSKSKWIKSGREQLGKDLGDIESALCIASKSTPSPYAELLMPVFLLLRRTFALPPSPLPNNMTESYLDLIPAPPDSDTEPFREPTVQSTTVALYQNPRLEDWAAMEVFEELLENEREAAEAAGASEEQKLDWLVQQVNSVKKRVSRAEPSDSSNELYDAYLASVSRWIIRGSVCSNARTNQDITLSTLVSAVAAALSRRRIAASLD